MIRAALLWLLLAAGALAAESPGHGLIENRTGLPLAFPLQIRTTTGRDAYLVLRDAETGEIAVTAYIEGGRFFRLLMPPGTYRLTAALGRDWEGQETLFGDETTLYEHDTALTFEVAGVARKAGYLIDLRGLDQEVGGPPADAPTRAIALCQDLNPPLEPSRRAAVPDPPEAPRSVAPDIPFGYPLPPGPRDPGLDGRPELGVETGNIVADVPLWLRLGEGRSAAPREPARPDRRRRQLRERLCG